MNPMPRPVYRCWAPLEGETEATGRDYPADCACDAAEKDGADWIGQQDERDSVRICVKLADGPARRVDTFDVRISVNYHATRVTEEIDAASK